MSKIRIYKDCKEIPFFIYKRIMLTGDFLYMIKGYEEGDDLEADPKEMEDKFNALVTDFALTVNAASEEISDHSNYLIASVEFNKLTIAMNFIDVMIKAQKLLSKENIDEDLEIKSLVTELLEGIKVERNPDLNIQRAKIAEKVAVYESNILKYKEILEKEDNTGETPENDLDKQFINICLILEIPFPDESKISLYQFSLMTERAVEKVKALEKISTK